MNQGYRLTKKTKDRKSCETVPLNLFCYGPTGEGPIVKYLKEQSHEIFDSWFFQESIPLGSLISV
jgi:hypothetical protein